ncbi:hypothetical protein EVAR_9109_1 [Eumeta japonica]|uniref:Uncharacterized protein n=1 Tax=Eumeta variegata TaxID=151549 RepID=A0A4C1TXA5_EUMVA|nr:hypothetical protein EVAR_9109_1 [Eumeta japonica]
MTAITSRIATNGAIVALRRAHTNVDWARGSMTKEYQKEQAYAFLQIFSCSLSFTVSVARMSFVFVFCESVMLHRPIYVLQLT